MFLIVDLMHILFGSSLTKLGKGEMSESNVRVRYALKARLSVREPTRTLAGFTLIRQVCQRKNQCKSQDRIQDRNQNELGDA